MSPTDLAPIACTPFASVPQCSCHCASIEIVNLEDQVPESPVVESEPVVVAESEPVVVAESEPVIIVESEPVVVVEPELVGAPIPAELEALLATAKEIKTMAEQITARDKTKNEISSDVSIARAARQFWLAFTASEFDSYESAMTQLMEVRVTDWHLILTQLYPSFFSKGFTAHGFWDCLEAAHGALSPERQLATGGLAAKNEQLIHLTMNYMAFRSLKHNKGKNTTIEEVQKILDSDRIGISDGSWKISMQIDYVILGSAIWIGDLSVPEMGVKAWKAALMALFESISSYCAKRCASILIKVMVLLSDQGQMNAILAFGDTPFVGAFKHIKKVVKEE